MLSSKLQNKLICENIWAPTVMSIMETNLSTTSPSTKITTKKIGQASKYKYIRGGQTLCKGPDSKNFMLCESYSLCHKLNFAM